MRGTLYVVAAPSGAGKTSLVAALAEEDDCLCVSVSHTTRAKRSLEVDGSHYHFVAPDVFADMIEQDAFLEHALVFGHHYGTSKHWVEEQLVKGIDVILEIDWQGARQIKQQFRQSVSIFVLPPSEEALKLRLQKRQQDDKRTIEERMGNAGAEISHYTEFDYLVINDDFQQALADLQAIIRTQRLMRERQVEKYRTVLANLPQEG